MQCTMAMARLSSQLFTSSLKINKMPRITAVAVSAISTIGAATAFAPASSFGRSIAITGKSSAAFGGVSTHGNGCPCGSCSQSRHGAACNCGSCARMSHSAICACPSCVESHSPSCACASCSSVHEANCACASCASVHSAVCKCPSCTGAHAADCSCVVCGGL